MHTLYALNTWTSMCLPLSQCVCARLIVCVCIRDPHFNCLIITVPQMKVVDTKHVTVSCAPHFNLDFSVVFALFLNKGGYGIHDQDAPSWLLPILQTVECPGSMVSGFVKALLPKDRGGQKGYQSVSVESLPSDASAAGLRKGVFSGSTECHVRVCADENASARVCIR